MSANDHIVVQASWINDAEFIGYFAAMDEGHYARAGISVDHRPGYSGLVPEMAVLEGEAQLALTSPESVSATVARTGAELRIIAAQFQKSPLSLVSSAAAPLHSAQDLLGKVIAVPPANKPLVDWLIRDSGIDADAVQLVTYDHTPARLMASEFDGFVDFAVDCSFHFSRQNYAAQSVLLHDLGARLFNNVVVVTADFLDRHRELLLRWLHASREGWQDNARDLSRFPRSLRRAYLTTERSEEAEVHANQVFAALMGAPVSYFSMSKQAIAENEHTLAGLNLPSSGLFFPLS